MANQGNRGGNQGKREREGSAGQGGREKDKPTGTSGRQDNTADQSQGDAGNPGSDRPRKNSDEDDDSPLGPRNTNR